VNTSQWVTFIKDKFAQDWSRANILDQLNIVNHILFDHDCDQAILHVDNSDFPVPYLKTTSGVIEYDVIDDNLSHPITLNGVSTTCRAVRDLFIKRDTQYDVTHRNEYQRERFQYSSLSPWYTHGALFERVPARFIPRRGTTAAKVIFPENPGTYTDRYFIEMWVNAIDLTSESIPLAINTNEFFDTILNGVVGLIELSEHGESKRYDTFINKNCHEFWAKSNKGSENKPLQIARREC